jgi:hypothetical protein
MKWKWIGTIAVIAIIAAGATMSLRAEKKEKHVLTVATVAPAPAPAPAANDAPHPKNSRDVAAAELVALIKETESPETFTMSLFALASLKPKDKTLVSLAIRQADRLGMMEGMLSDKLTPAQEALADVMEMIIGDDFDGAKIRGNRGQQSCSSGPTVLNRRNPRIPCPAPPSYTVPSISTSPLPGIPPPGIVAEQGPPSPSSYSTSR